MSLRDFQRALTDITLDAHWAAQVRRNGDSPLKRYVLTPRERDRLVRVARQAGMELNCTLARTNRFAAIADSYPMSCVVIEPELRALLDALWARDQPQGYQLTSDVACFAAHLGADLGLHQRFPYLGEIFRYEQACIELINETRRLPMAAMKGRVRRLDFLHDPGALLPPLQRHEAPPPGLTTAPHCVEIELLDGVLESRWWALPAPGLAA